MLEWKGLEIIDQVKIISAMMPSVPFQYIFLMIPVPIIHFKDSKTAPLLLTLQGPLTLIVKYKDEFDFGK